MLFICYERCSTCKKAEKYLNELGVEFTKRPIKEENPSYEEIKAWHELSGLDIKRFFNTSGNLYKSMELKDKLPNMDLEAKYQLLATDGMLVKRPLLINDDKVLVGFKEAEWDEYLK